MSDTIPRPAGPTILGVHSGALGDVIVLAQLLGALTRRSGGRTRLLAGGTKARLLAGLGAVDDALDFNALPMSEVFAAAPVARCALPTAVGSCDLLVSCFATGQPAAESRLAALCSADQAHFLPVRPPADYRRHLVDFWAEQLGAGAVPPPRWSVPNQWKRRARQALAEAGAEADEPYLLIHPGSGSPEKCWPAERFVRAAGAAAAPAVFVLGPAELDRWDEPTVSSIRRRFATLICPELEVLAAAAAGAKRYLGNDSGPTHLAAAVGAETVAVFGPTDPVHFAPRGRSVRVVAEAALADVTIETVLAALA